MTPAELYSRAHETVDHEISNLRGFHFNHIPELHEFAQLPHCDPNCRVQLRYYSDQCPDGRRIWRLFSVWLLDSNNDWLPVMICQNAGREGDDHAERFITDLQTYGAMIAYLTSLTEAESPKLQDIVDPNLDIPDLTSFYGASLDGPPYRG